MAESDIVCTAKKLVKQDGSTQVIVGSSSNSGGNVYSGGGHSAGNTNTSNQHTASVNVQVSDPAHLAEAIDAANNIAKALAEISDLLDKSPAGATFTWDGQTFSRDGMRAELDKTQFIVNDDASYGNGGVGSSFRGAGSAPNVDKLNYHFFSSSNSTGYAASTYHGQGVAAMMLHELGHMTQQGFNSTTNNYIVFGRDYGTSRSYEYSDYWRNDENFAHDFEVKAAGMLGLHVNLYEGAVAHITIMALGRIR